jgi:hypothetical protein
MESKMIEHYPSDIDVFSVITEKTTYGNVRDFYRKRGILYITNNRPEIGLHCCRLFLGVTDYEEMRKNTLVKKNFKRISGIELDTTKDIQEIGDVLSRKRGECLDEKSDLKITDVVSGPGDTIRCKVEYISKNIGTVDLLKEGKNDYWFEIEKKDERKLILTHHERNEDYAKILDIFNIISGDFEEQEKITLHEISLDNFSIEQKIEFFDRILLHKYDDFRSENITSIKIRKGNSEDEEEVSSLDLKGINEAILNGDNLRTNEFVKKFEKNGYYFYGVGIKLGHKTEPITILLEIFFKHKPSLPEISIKDSCEIIDGNEQKRVLPESEQKKLLTLFWDTLTKIYYDYLKEVRQRAKK